VKKFMNNSYESCPERVRNNFRTLHEEDEAENVGAFRELLILAFIILFSMMLLVYFVVF